MAKVTIKLVEDISKVKEKILKSGVIVDELNRIFQNRRNAIRERVTQAFIDALERTDAIQGLLGAYAGDTNKDLAAHMGLNEGDALLAWDEIQEIIRDKCEVSTVRATTPGGRAASFNKAAKLDLNVKLEDLASELGRASTGSYQSEQSGANIDWLQWLAESFSPTFSADITFDLVGLQQFRSRSGRAVMVSMAGASWDIQQYNSFSRTGNFILDALQDGRWEKEIVRIIVSEMSR